MRSVVCGLLVVGCAMGEEPPLPRPPAGSDTDTAPPVDTAGPSPAEACAAAVAGTHTGPPRVRTTHVGCDAAGEDVAFLLCAAGATGGGRVFVEETASAEVHWSENVSLASVASDPGGAWDALAHALAAGAALATYAPDVNTLFTCDRHFAPEAGVLSYAWLVYDPSGAPAECVAWGDDPQRMIDGGHDRVNEPAFALDGCRIVP